MTGPSAPQPRPAARRGRPWTVRVAAWSAGHRWPVLLGWFALTIGVFALSISVGGIRTVGATGGPSGTTTESQHANDVFDGAGTADPHETMTIVITSATSHATDASFRSTVQDVLSRLSAVTATVNGTTGPAFRQLVDPYQAPAQAGLVAPDQTGVRIEGDIGGDGAAVETRTQAIAPVLTAIESRASRLCHPRRGHHPDQRPDQHARQRGPGRGVEDQPAGHVPDPAGGLRGGRGGRRAADPGRERAARRVRPAGAVQPHLRRREPVRHAAGRPHRPGRGGRLLVVHGHPLPLGAPRRP